MQGISSSNFIYYCLKGEESKLFSMLASDKEFVRQLWADAYNKFPGNESDYLKAEKKADEAMGALSEVFCPSEDQERFDDMLLECASRWSDAGMAFANQMFLKGLVYGFAYLGKAISDRQDKTIAM